MTGNEDTAGHDLLGRFAHALARIIHEERPELVGRTVTVAELYQDIAPYRRLRELADFEMHADYEHALLRFLAGEGGHAQLDPETAADELGIEAESADPDLSLYRKFAACDVRLALGAPLPPRPEPPPEPEPEPEQIVEIAPVVKPMPGIEETLRALRIEPAQAPVQAQPQANAPRCGFCGNALPRDREVHFCPHCGADQTAHACASCGEALQEGWRFCVACGAAAES